MALELQEQQRREDKYSAKKQELAEEERLRKEVEAGMDAEYRAKMDAIRNKAKTQVAKEGDRHHKIEEKAKYEKCVLFLQTRWRGTRMKQYRERYEQRKAKWPEEILTIQRRTRGWMERMRAHERKTHAVHKACIVMQSRRRAHLAVLEYNEKKARKDQQAAALYWAINYTQRRYRGMKGQKLGEERRMWWACFVVQTRYRCREAREMIKNLRAGLKQRTEDLERSTIWVQKHFRAWLARRREQELRFKRWNNIMRLGHSAWAVQKRWRAQEAKKDVRQRALRRACLLTQCRLRGKMAQREGYERLWLRARQLETLEEVVLIVQTRYRGGAMRKHGKERKKKRANWKVASEAAALYLQTKHRGFIQQKIIRIYRRQKAATIIQARIRSKQMRALAQEIDYLKKKDQQDQVAASLFLQTRFRGHLAKGEIDTRAKKKAATYIQSKIRQKQAVQKGKELKERQQAALFMQSRYRSTQAQQQAKAKIELEEQAALYFQRRFRGHLGKQGVAGRVEKKAKLRAEEEAAAVWLQKRIRGMREQRKAVEKRKTRRFEMEKGYATLWVRVKLDFYHEPVSGIYELDDSRDFANGKPVWKQKRENGYYLYNSLNNHWRIGKEYEINHHLVGPGVAAITVEAHTGLQGEWPTMMDSTRGGWLMRLDDIWRPAPGLVVGAGPQEHAKVTVFGIANLRLLKRKEADKRQEALQPYVVVRIVPPGDEDGHAAGEPRKVQAMTTATVECADHPYWNHHHTFLDYNKADLVEVYVYGKHQKSRTKDGHAKPDELLCRATLSPEQLVPTGFDADLYLEWTFHTHGGQGHPPNKAIQIMEEGSPSLRLRVELALLYDPNIMMAAPEIRRSMLAALSKEGDNKKVLLEQKINRIVGAGSLALQDYDLDYLVRRELNIPLELASHERVKELADVLDTDKIGCFTVASFLRWALWTPDQEKVEKPAGGQSRIDTDNTLRRVRLTLREALELKEVPTQMLCVLDRGLGAGLDNDRLEWMFNCMDSVKRSFDAAAMEPGRLREFELTYCVRRHLGIRPDDISDDDLRRLFHALEPGRHGYIRVIQDLVPYLDEDLSEAWKAYQEIKERQEGLQELERIRMEITSPTRQGQSSAKKLGHQLLQLHKDKQWEDFQRKVYEQADVSGDGYINEDEYVELFIRSGVSEALLASSFRSILADVNAKKAIPARFLSIEELISAGKAGRETPNRTTWTSKDVLQPPWTAAKGQGPAAAEAKSALGKLKGILLKSYVSLAQSWRMLLDANGTGFVSKNDFGAVVKQKSLLTVEETRQAWTELDPDKSGTVSLLEFDWDVACRLGDLYTYLVARYNDVAGCARAAIVELGLTNGGKMRRRTWLESLRDKNLSTSLEEANELFWILCSGDRTKRKQRITAEGFLWLESVAGQLPLPSTERRKPGIGNFTPLDDAEGGAGDPEWAGLEELSDSSEGDDPVFTRLHIDSKRRFIDQVRRTRTSQSPVKFRRGSDSASRSPPRQRSESELRRLEENEAYVHRLAYRPLQKPAMSRSVSPLRSKMESDPEAFLRLTVARQDYSALAETYLVQAPVRPPGDPEDVEKLFNRLHNDGERLRKKKQEIVDRREAARQKDQEELMKKYHDPDNFNEAAFDRNHAAEEIRRTKRNQYLQRLEMKAEQRRKEEEKLAKTVKPGLHTRLHLSGQERGKTRDDQKRHEELLQTSGHQANSVHANRGPNPAVFAKLHEAARGQNKDKPDFLGGDVTLLAPETPFEPPDGPQQDGP
eukprot:TRINITY_DN10369_c0_g2_i3.p1 TRINITY_DN10369_c0_g2~~TRINITY_DN10369_c0_g2_i3.p1  ORF type:complete len:1984 (+),score=507.10 TRINITY_DN10369_c0_g2_i3:702-5954(+)